MDISPKFRSSATLIAQLLLLGGLAACVAPGCAFLWAFTSTFYCEVPGNCGRSGALLRSWESGGLGEITPAGDEVQYCHAWLEETARGFTFAMTPEGLRLYAASGAGLRVGDGAPFSRPYKTIAVPECGPMGDVVVLDGGDVIVSCPETNRLVRIDPVAERVVDSFSCCEGVETSFRPFAIALGPNETVLAGTTEINAFDARTGESLGVTVPGGTNGATTYDDLVFGPNGHLFVSANPDVGVLEFNGTTFELLRVFVPAGTEGLEAPAALAFSTEGNLFVGSAVEPLVLEFDGQTGEFVREVMRKEYNSPVSFMAFHP